MECSAQAASTLWRNYPRIRGNQNGSKAAIREDLEDLEDRRGSVASINE